jgi:hypothetical protein
MSTFSEARVLAVMRERRCDYRSACAFLGARGGRARGVKSEKQRLERVRRTWAWARDFEL